MSQAAHAAAPEAIAEEAPGVAVGAEGFLFHRSENAFEQICGGTLPSDRQLARWQSLFETRYAWCQQRDIVYATLVVPERHVIYGDRLPPGYEVSPDRAIMRLSRAMGDFAPLCLLYPEAVLREGREGGDVFFQTDEHINPRGAYLCYRTLFAHVQGALPLRPLAADAYSVSTYDYTGNLGMQLDSEPSEEAQLWLVPEMGGAARVFDSGPGRGRVEVFQHARPDLPTAIFLGDSNLFSLWHFLVPHFSRLIFLHDNDRMFHDLIRREQPDLVVHVLSESRLGNSTEPGLAYVPVDTDIIDFEDVCPTPLPKRTEWPLLLLDFGMPESGAGYLLQGWADPEPGHCWMTGQESHIVCPPLTLPEGKTHLRIELQVTPHLHPEHASRQRLDLFCIIRGERLHLGGVAVEESGSLSWDIEASGLIHTASLGRYLVLGFEHPDAFAPSAAGSSADDRMLSCSVQRLAIWAIESPSD
ncbi:alginate O-acetyltransferase AlgX-related protein [Acidisoma sp. C75]